MKVNMSLIEPEAKAPAMEETQSPKPTEQKTEPVQEEKEEEVIDELDKHSKIKTFLLVAAMVGGFGLFVWNMTSLANNMRLDNQGSASAVYEMDDRLEGFMDDSDGSGAISSTEVQESEVSTDAARDGPVSDESTVHAQTEEEPGEDKELDQLLKEAYDAKALIEQELKNAEDMLDSSLAREAALKSELDALKGAQ